ncbi:hypothetical protein CW304_13230 [Bacillus sp. UFRGS-B20]|nr:hypothetical protein CW304_13230 [Bacillus sp. UFRGS-B20]
MSLHFVTLVGTLAIFQAFSIIGCHHQSSLTARIIGRSNSATLEPLYNRFFHESFLVFYFFPILQSVLSAVSSYFQTLADGGRTFSDEFE